MYKIPANTLFLGKNLVFVPECHSTNTLALQLSQNPSTAEGSVVITNNQTAGRGQRGNTWETEPGMNITFSVILRPGFLAVKDQFYLNIITALAIHDFLTETTEESVYIKWPNDILVQNRKICGILIENQIQGSSLISTVIGIGLNVNQTQFVIDSPVSVKYITGQSMDLQEVMEKLLGRLEARYLQLHQNKQVLLHQEYVDRLYWRGETHTFTSEDLTFDGRIITVDKSGKLVIETCDELRYFGIKEIRYLK